MLIARGCRSVALGVGRGRVGVGVGAGCATCTVSAGEYAESFAPQKTLYLTLIGPLPGLPVGMVISVEFGPSGFWPLVAAPVTFTL